MQEEKTSDSAEWVTLTYDTRHAPITSNGFLTLNKRDIQLFFKRLRKANPGRRIRYYCVGEYGTKNWRPHYHAHIFNVDVTTIQPAWHMGQVYYGKVQGASVGYTLKYMMKKGRIPQHARDDRQPEYAQMSKGLGASYLTDAMVAWHRDDLYNRMYVVVDGNQKVAMPRYLKQKLYTDPEREEIGLRARSNMLKEQDKIVAAGGPNYWRNRAESIKAAFARMDRQFSFNKTI